MLTDVRIAQIENQINAGLIEEVIQVAKNEFELVDVMEKAQVYVSNIPIPPSHWPSPPFQALLSGHITNTLIAGRTSRRSQLRANGPTSSAQAPTSVPPPKSTYD